MMNSSSPVVLITLLLCLCHLSQASFHQFCGDHELDTRCTYCPTKPSVVVCVSGLEGKCQECRKHNVKKAGFRLCYEHCVSQRIPLGEISNLPRIADLPLSFVVNGRRIYDTDFKVKETSEGSSDSPTNVNVKLD